MIRALFAASIATVLLSLALDATAQQRRYTMKDLDALAAGKSWIELAEHLDDIAPASRNKAWEQLAERAGIGLLEGSVAQQRPLEGIMTSEHLLRRYGHLQRSRSFMDKRAEVGLKSFEGCFADRWSAEHCGKELRTFVAADPDNRDLAFKAGKLARLNMRDWFAAPFFKAGLVKESASRSCSDEDVKLATMAALVLPDHDNYRPFIDAGVSIARDLCWAPLQNALMTQLKENNSYFAANSCAFLKAKSSADPAVAAACK